MLAREPQACYVHIPFCVRKCAYCDFNSYAGYTTKLVERYVDALDQEVRRTVERHPIDTVFFGGGTPTAIPAQQQADLLKTVLDTFPNESPIEITTEANPGSSDVAGLSALRDAGFNRISFGVQSFDDGLLKKLDRIHSSSEAISAVQAARNAGFENISIDLMFGLPDQTLTQWADTLDKGLSLGVQHISLYNLIVEDGTGFATLQKKGRLLLPDNDTMAEMYQMAIDRATDAGLSQYEISNFAAQGRECRHNIHYWQNDVYYGFGAGAVSYSDGIRRTNVKRPAAYCQAVETLADLSEDVDSSPPTVRMSESMMLGLRMTTEGVSIARFKHDFSLDPRDLWAGEIEKYVGYGLLDVDDERVRLTERGKFMANDVMAAFL
jgi:oxygen-independent coproporphyrinogen-3 oxidase